MEKSLVVTGRSLELALDKAALLLHCAKETVAYEILREGTAPVRGRASVSWKIKATPVAPAPDDAPSAPSPDNWDADTPLPADWQEWAELPHAAFLACLTAALGALPPLIETTTDAAPLGPARTVHGDFGRGQETLRHDGHVRIEGSVRRGAKVSAAGTLHVAGDVETAQIEAGGTVTIAGGILGTARSLRGDVSCRFAQGARLLAPKGSVYVQDSAMHSHLDAGKTINVGHVILGGTAYAEDLVETETAGSPSGVPTLLTAGRNQRLHRDAENITAQAAAVVAHIGRLNAQRLLAAETVPERERLWQTMTRLVQAHEALQGLAREKNETLGMINQEHGSRVCVEGRVFPNVRIVLDDTVLDVDVLTQFASFSKDYDTGEMRLTPFR